MFNFTFRYIPTQALAGDPVELAFESIKEDADQAEIVNGDKQAKVRGSNR